ncbi:MAG: hypothetical protein ACI9EF_002847 [Pseudohongiellaceae bacterium]|jgi:hypothetical protein
MTHLEVIAPAAGEAATRWRLHLLPLELSIIEGLPEQLEALLGDPDNNRRVIERLFPTRGKPRASQAADRAMLGSSLLDSRKELLSDFRRLLREGQRDAKGLHIEVDSLGMDVVLRFANDVRMVLATDLDIEKNLDDDPPASLGRADTAKWALLEYLGGIEALLVDALCREM